MSFRFSVLLSLLNMQAPPVSAAVRTIASGVAIALAAVTLLA